MLCFEKKYIDFHLLALKIQFLLLVAGQILTMPLSLNNLYFLCNKFSCILHYGYR